MNSETLLHWRTPSSDAEKAAIMEQLERLLQDPCFNLSKRYPSFLRFVVNNTLNGAIDSLKERVIGVEVFGRSPDYDSTQDPIVRVTAAEIRKRLLRYYQDPQHKSEIRLLLPAGTYVPHFDFPDDGSGAAPYDQHLSRIESQAQSTDTTQAHPDTANTAADAPKKPRNLIRIGIALALLVALAAAITLWRYHQPTLIESFWAPALESSKPVLFCIADQSIYANQPVSEMAPPPNQNSSENHMMFLAADDTVPMVNYISMMRSKVHPFHVQVQAQTTFTDLGQGPTVLIGAFDNKWTLFLTEPLRFHFANDPGLKQLWIEDRQFPNKRDWRMDENLPDNSKKDYGLVARFLDPNTKQIAIVVAGLGHNGTTAAGDFIYSQQYLSELDQIAPHGWKNQNIEVVLETMVVNGHPGPPHIAAFQVW
jgi:hypothetical protein